MATARHDAACARLGNPESRDNALKPGYRKRPPGIVRTKGAPPIDIPDPQARDRPRPGDSKVRGLPDKSRRGEPSDHWPPGQSPYSEELAPGSHSAWPTRPCTGAAFIAPHNKYKTTSSMQRWIMGCLDYGPHCSFSNQEFKRKDATESLDGYSLVLGSSIYKDSAWLTHRPGSLTLPHTPSRLHARCLRARQHQA